MHRSLPNPPISAFRALAYLLLTIYKDKLKKRHRTHFFIWVLNILLQGRGNLSVNIYEINCVLEFLNMLPQTVEL